MKLTPSLVVLLLAASCSDGPTGSSATLPVVGIVDGDSLVVAIDGDEVDVRLLGINAPERDECFGDRGRHALATAVAAGDIALAGPDERDQYGRLLRYLSAAGTDVNEMMVDEGVALATSDAHPRRDAYWQAEADAFAGRRGMWAPDACGPPAPERIEIAAIEPDPPGPDDPNEEWVTVANRGDGTADLDGWGLRDESSVHRFRFPYGFRLTAGASVRVRSGCGRDGPDELHWCADGPVWSNGGDTVLLTDAFGNVAGRLPYGGKP